MGRELAPFGSTKRLSKSYYIDGVPLITTEASGKIESGFGYNLLIGAGRDTEPATNLYKGLIDEVRIYNYALTNEKVSALYHLVYPPTVTVTVDDVPIDYTSAFLPEVKNIGINFRPILRVNILYKPLLLIRIRQKYFFITVTGRL